MKPKNNLIAFKSYLLAKPGEIICQDSIFNSTDKMKFAIADGVSQSFYPEVFSHLLVKTFCENQDNDILFTGQLLNWLSPIQDTWQKIVSERISNLPSNLFIIKNKFILKEPAASTFAAIEFNENRKNLTFRIINIGDSCIYQIRNDELINIFGLKNSSEYNSFPGYLASYSIHDKSKSNIYHGSAMIGDIFIMVTDEISKWIITHHEKSHDHWNYFLSWLTYLYYNPEDFQNLIKLARIANHEILLGDDDVAIGIITVGRPELFQKFHSNKSYLLIGKIIESLPQSIENQIPDKPISQSNPQQADITGKEFEKLPIIDNNSKPLIRKTGSNLQTSNELKKKGSADNSQFIPDYHIKNEITKNYKSSVKKNKKLKSSDNEEILISNFFFYTFLLVIIILLIILIIAFSDDVTLLFIKNLFFR